MERFDLALNDIPELPAAAACIGYFDGVHRGHQELIRHTIRLAQKQNSRSAAITFTPDPVSVYAPQSAHRHLSDDDQKAGWFARYGLDAAYFVHFDEAFCRQSVEEFKAFLGKLDLTGLVCGNDYRFAQNAAGNTDDLTGGGLPFPVEVVEPVLYRGRKIASRWILEAVRQGDISLAQYLLGHPLTIRAAIHDHKVVSRVNQLPLRGRAVLQADGRSLLADFDRGGEVAERAEAAERQWVLAPEDVGRLTTQPGGFVLR
jgi:riboflavin kinase/FMN adenylyltransferase